MLRRISLGLLGDVVLRCVLEERLRVDQERIYRLLFGDFQLSERLAQLRLSLKRALPARTVTHTFYK